MAAFTLMGKKYTTGLEQAEANKRIYGLAGLILEFENIPTDTAEKILDKARKTLNKTRSFDGNMHLLDVHKVYVELRLKRRIKEGVLSEESFKDIMYVVNL